MLSFKNQVNLFELIKSHNIHCFRNLTLAPKKSQLYPVICFSLIRILICHLFSWFTTILFENSFVGILPSLLPTNLKGPMFSFKNQVNLFELIKSHQVHCFRNLNLALKKSQLYSVICFSLIRIIICQLFSWFTIDIFSFN